MEEDQVADSKEEGKDEDEEMIVEQRQQDFDEEQDIEDTADDINFDYKLVGVVIHMGIAEAGHYLSYINIDRDTDSDSASWANTEKQTWLEFNDSSIFTFDFTKLEKKCFGED